MARGFRTPQACSLSGATYRMVDYWARTGVLVPTVDANGSGTQRLYSFREVQALWMLAQLARLQVSTPARTLAARAVLDADEFGGYLVVTPTSAMLVPHVLALADVLTEVPTVAAVVQLDRCDVDAEVLVS